MIKTYENELAWASASKSTTESTIGLLLDSNTPVLNGVNVQVKIPKYGDAVVLDENGNIVFIARGTFVNSAFPSNWTKIGVVYRVRGKKVDFVSYTSLGAMKYSAVWRLEITGYTLDGANHTVTWNTYDNDGTNTPLSWTYNASFVEDFITQFNTWAETSGNDPNNRGYYMYLDDNNVVQLVEPNYTTYRQQSDGFSGITSVANVATEIPNISWNLDQDGVSRLYNIVNIGAIKRWGGRTLSAVEVITMNNTPISETSFNSAYGVNYQNTYGTYDNYLEHVCAKIPVNRGVCSWRGVGHDYTYALANLTYKTKAGADAYMYTAPHQVSTFGYSANELVAPGKWYIPDVEEMVTIMRPITVGNSGISTYNQYDELNKTITDMEGNRISTNATRWCSCHCNSAGMWLYDSYGYLGYTGFYNSFTVVPVCSFIIS